MRKTVAHVWSLLKPRRRILAAGFCLVLVNRLSGLVLPASTKYLLDNIILKRQLNLLLPLALAVLAATFIEALTSYLLTKVMSESAHRMIAELRIKIQAHVERLPLIFHDTNKTGALVSRIMNDPEGVRHLIGTGVVEFAGAAVTAFVALIYMLRASVMMTLVAGAGLLVLVFVLSRTFGFFRSVYHLRSGVEAEVTGRLVESISGIRVVKGYHAEKHEDEVFATGVLRLLRYVIKTLTSSALIAGSSSLFTGTISAIVIVLGVHQIVSGRMTPGAFFAYTMFLAMLVKPVSHLVRHAPFFSEAVAALERTQELLNERPEDRNPARTIQLDRIRGRIDFENVGFSYDSKRPVLHDITFKVESGTITALVGPSGAGKSTIIGLIAAFYVPTAGRVLVDGIDLASVRLDSLRTQLGIVLQESFLFDGTIRENVALGRPTASDREIVAACRVARVDEFAETFEKQYDTVVGERGVKLSGGQRQRVSIARAILTDPRILILDEATSSVDSKSEALIQEALQHLMSGRTTIVIAHRLSTIRRANQILFVEGGRVVERGTHEFLYGTRGRYHDLYMAQQALHTNLFLGRGEEIGDFAEFRVG
jgi:ABC-type multidrug transport system fused ATPase/permease subunit